MRVCTSLAGLLLAACGSSSTTPDAPMGVDAAGPSVRALTCPPGSMPTVTTDESALAYAPPSTTISAHGIVKFMMSPSHNVAPNPLRATDPGLMVDYGKIVCLEFDKASTFNFQCLSHGFVGTIVVQ